jgi:MFS family permease
MIFNRSFNLVFLTTFLFFASFYLILPVMPRYVMSLGGHEVAVGLVMGFFTISAVIARPFVGRFVDRRGCKVMISLGSALFLVSSLLYMLFENLEAIYLIRILHGLGIASFTVGATTLVSQTAPLESRGEVLGFYTISTIIAMALFPWVGDILARYSFQYAFIVSSLLALLSLLLSFFVSDYVGEKEEGAIFSTFLIVPTLTIFLVASSYGAIISFIPLMTRRVGTFYFLYAFSVIVSRIAFVGLSDKMGRRKIINPALIVTALGMFLLKGGNEVLISFAAIIYGIGFGTAYPTLNVLIVDKLKRRAEALSIFSAAFDGGIACGSIILGAIAQFYGFSVMVLYASAIVMLGFFVFSLSSRGWGEEKL